MPHYTIIRLKWFFKYFREISIFSNHQTVYRNHKSLFSIMNLRVVYLFAKLYWNQTSTLGYQICFWMYRWGVWGCYIVESPSPESYEDTTTCPWRAANFVLYSALRLFEQGGVFFIPASTATWDLSSYIVIWRSGLHIPQWDSDPWRKDQILTSRL